MVQGIEHTAIASPDTERLAQWYVAHLGFAINYRGSGNTIFIKTPKGSMIEIIESKAPSPGVSGMRDPGIRHLALEVEDVSAEAARLKAAGISFLSEPETRHGTSTAFFTDCDGNILHLLHRENPLP